MTLQTRIPPQKASLPILSFENELDHPDNIPAARAGDSSHGSESGSDTEGEHDDLALEIWDCDSETDSEKETEVIPSEQIQRIHFLFSYFLFLLPALLSCV